MTVFDNVAYGLTLRRMGRSEVRQRVDAILGATRLGPLADRYPGELSGGQQQRVALARALVVDPEILLLDEPLSNLDANLREEMRYEIRRLHDTYRYTTIYVTHDQAEAMTAADLIVVMNGGRVEQVGSPEDVYQRPRSEFVARFIGATNIFKGRRIAGDAVDCGDIVLRCGAGEFAASGETAVSIRQHEVRLLTEEPPDPFNRAAGTVTRQTYLGAHRDYVVTLAGGAQVRTIAPSHLAIEPGRAVWLHFPPEHCRALPH
jgi:iron(III) transport system ATP-binding protein